MQPEPTVVMFVLRAALTLWAVALLVFGVKMPRAMVGTFLMVVGLAVGAFAAAEMSVLLAAATAWLVVAVGIGLFLVAPRLVMAVSLIWPLPALYAAHLYFSGSFERSMPVLFGLMLLGAALGAVFPQRSVVLLSAAVGTVLLLVAGPIEASFLRVVVIAAAAAAWQLVAFGAWRSSTAQRERIGSPREATRMKRWTFSLRWAAAVLVAGLVVVSLTAPRYDAGSVADPGRLRRLAQDGGLGRPGLVITTLNNFYLSGRAVPVALVGEASSVVTRLIFPFAGQSLSGEVRRMRAVKEDGELASMRRAAAITSRAFEDIHSAIEPGVSEADIERMILDSFSRNGATGVAFKAVVGSGANAVLPHYQKNDAEIQEGLVVIDIGSSVGGYASDMTRTFAVSGRYNDAEKHLIDTVIEAGDAARDALRPGATLKDVDTASRRVIEGAGFGPYYNHSVGHHVGLNVHDPGGSPLEPGMVLTIEPGIYIPAGADTDPAYWNLGVRIEDTYIVTEGGWEAITQYPRRPYPPGDSHERPGNS